MKKNNNEQNAPANDIGYHDESPSNVIMRTVLDSLERQRSIFVKRQHNLPKDVRLSVETQHGQRTLVNSYQLNGARHRHNLNPKNSDYKRYILSYIYDLAIKNIEEAQSALERVDFSQHSNCLTAALSSVCQSLPIFDADQLSDWVRDDLTSSGQKHLNALFKTVDFLPEYRIHRTLSGIKVRSKSEATIADHLFLHNVPFVYEPAIIINQNTFYPDFLAERVDGQLFYWEHFGLTNDEEYLQKMQTKLQAYKSVNIVPWNNLIVTYDALDGSIDVPRIVFEIESRLLRI